MELYGTESNISHVDGAPDGILLAARTTKPISL